MYQISLGGEAWDMRPWSHLVVDSPTKTFTLGKLKAYNKTNSLSTTPGRTQEIICSCAFLSFLFFIFKKKAHKLSKQIETKREGIHAHHNYNICCVPPTLLDFYPTLVYIYAYNLFYFILFIKKEYLFLLLIRIGPFESVNSFFLSYLF